MPPSGKQAKGELKTCPRCNSIGKDGTGTSSDPADPDKTLRVLTLYAIDDVLA